MINETLHELFVKFDYKWKIGGKLVTPSAEDLGQAIDSAKDVLYAESIGSQVGVGRLLVSKYDKDKFDVYLLIGE